MEEKTMPKCYKTHFMHAGWVREWGGKLLRKQTVLTLVDTADQLQGLVCATGLTMSVS